MKKSLQRLAAKRAVRRAHKKLGIGFRIPDPAPAFSTAQKLIESFFSAEAKTKKLLRALFGPFSSEYTRHAAEAWRRTTKHLPNGNRERARRIRQINSGQLRHENGLVAMRKAA